MHESVGIGALVAQTLKFLEAGTKQVFAAGVRVGLMIDLFMQLLHVDAGPEALLEHLAETIGTMKEAGTLNNDGP